MFSQDVYSIYGDNDNVELVASVCEKDRRIYAKLDSKERESWAEAMERREFRSFQSMMRGNVGVHI